MRIMYDFQIFSTQNYGGISRYFYELYREIKKEKDTEVVIPIKYSDNYYLSKTDVKKNYLLSKKKFRGKNRISSYFNKKYAIESLKKNDFDVFHPTYYDTYFLNYIGKKPFVLTIHDMIHEKYPSFFRGDPTINNKKKLIEEANKIITISENTKNDLLNIYNNINPQKIEVIHHGNSITDQRNIDNVKIDLPNKYLLFLGKRNGYKNFENFIKAIQSAVKNDQDLKVLCVGGGSFTELEKKLFKKINIEKSVMQREVSDIELIEVYKNAIAFVFPSLYEGFGMPILEAYACNCPLICSNTSSFPEIAMEGASYFNPNNIDSIKNSIEKVLNNPVYRQKLIRRGSEIEKKFSWQKTKDATISLYESLV